MVCVTILVRTWGVSQIQTLLGMWHLQSPLRGVHSNTRVVELCGAAVSWASKKQTVVATSTCESEYIAACYDAKEGTWLRQMLRELGCGDLLGGATPVGIDNNGALCLIVNGATNARTRHTRVSFHFVRACHASGELEYCSVSTEAQHADFLTKALAVPTFERNVAFVGLTRVE